MRVKRECFVINGFVTNIMLDLNIYRTANELIKQHGEDASIHAAMRADKMLEAGDMNGQAVWKCVLAAIDELLAEDRPSDTKLH